MIRRLLRDPDYFQACAYSFAVAAAVALIVVGAVTLRGGR